MNITRKRAIIPKEELMMLFPTLFTLTFSLFVSSNQSPRLRSKRYETLSIQYNILQTPSLMELYLNKIAIYIRNVQPFTSECRITFTGVLVSESSQNRISPPSTLTFLPAELHGKLVFPFIRKMLSTSV
jgi:hypothetical protein